MKKLFRALRRRAGKLRRLLLKPVRYLCAAVRYLRDGNSEEIQNRYYYKKLQRKLPELELYKKETYEHVLNRAQEVNCPDMKAYYRYYCRSEDERRYLRQNMTLKGTHFFRGNDWEYFITHCLSVFASRPETETVRVWCAGCSSGEEAYSVVMGLLDYVPIERIRVLATDYNEELLEKVRRGTYFRMHYTEIPEQYRQHVAFDEKGSRFIVAGPIREVVDARRLDLLTDSYPTGFDVVLCRNVMKFFRPEQIAVVQEKLAASVAPGGFLFTATDDDHGGLELIPECERFGLTQQDGRCIYQRMA